MNWYTKIHIKHLFETKTTPELVTKLCKSLISQLTGLMRKVECSTLSNNDKEYLISHLEESIDHFEFCKSFSTKEIPEEEYSDYDFDGDLQGLFNSYLQELYDLGDTPIKTDTKFIWID